MVAEVSTPRPHASPPPAATASRDARGPTIWGLGPLELHDHYWAARGVHVVRQGGGGELREDAELFLLARPRTLVLFRMRALVETLSWVKPEVTYVRLRGTRGH